MLGNWIIYPNSKNISILLNVTELTFEAGFLIRQRTFEFRKLRRVS